MPKALKLRERVPAMANPHKSERMRACGVVKKIKPAPKGVNKKTLRERKDKLHPRENKAIFP